MRYRLYKPTIALQDTFIGDITIFVILFTVKRKFFHQHSNDLVDYERSPRTIAFVILSFFIRPI